MKDSNRLENIAAYNHRSLNTLARAIKLSREKFSLIIALCNYADLRGDILQLLRQEFEVEIQEFIVPESTTTLYTTINNLLGDNPPAALMVFGLESVANLDLLLGSANRLRDRFRSLPFPMILWVTDAVLKKLVSQAPDFKTFASSPISFFLPNRELVALVYQKVELAFSEADCCDFERGEIEAVRKDLQSRESELDEESKACLAFLVGWGYAHNQQIEMAVEKYRESWLFWEQNNELEYRGIVELNIALAYEDAGEKYAQLGRDCFRKSIESFELANRQDLVARHINKLGRSLQKLKDWDSLKIVAEKALPLHLKYGEVRQLVEDFSFLARVAVEDCNWRAGKELMLLVLAISDDNISDGEKGLHRFILGLSQQELGEKEKAVANFKKAVSYLESSREEIVSEYDAKFHVEILNLLRDLLFERKEYLAAFNYKLERRKIESQYGLRAFIGAGRLQPPPTVRNAAGKSIEEKRKIARKIVAASGREPDVERLIAKMKSTPHKLTVIYGQSGVGKSSILQAGLIPALQLTSFEGRKYLPVLLQVYQDWLDSLGKELVKGLKKEKVTKVISNFSAEEILEELRRNEDRALLTVLIFDQFEEFFFERQDSTSRREFYKFLRQCLEIPYLKVILSLREDYFYCLFEFTRLFPQLNIDKNYDDIIYYLGNFSPWGAKAVIASSTKGTPTKLDGDLVDELVGDLAKEFDWVRPIELQVVGTQLEREKISTLEEYQKKGPKNALVGRFLEDTIKDCGLEYEEKAKLILYLLTDEKETRPLKTRDDFELEVAVESETLDLILEVLVKSGLVLRVPALPNDRYQLVHDYLVPFVRQLQSAPVIAQLENEREKRKLTEDKLNKALKKQLRTARKAAIALGGLVVIILAIAAGATLFGINSYLSSLTASSKQNEELDRLVSAIEAGKQFKPLSLGVLPENKLRVAEELNQAVYGLTELSRLEGHESSVTSISFSDDGQMVASVSEDGIAKLWRINGEFIRDLNEDTKKIVSVSNLNEDTEKIVSVSFSPDNKTIAIAGEKTVRLHSLEDGTYISTFPEAIKESVTSLRFSQDGKMLAMASQNAIQLWNIYNHNIEPLPKHQGNIVSLAFSKDGKIVSADDYDRVILWSRDDRQIPDGFENYGTVDIKFSNNRQTIILINRDGTIKEYSFDGTLLKSFELLNPVQIVSNDNKWFLDVNTYKMTEDKDYSIIEIFSKNNQGFGIEVEGKVNQIKFSNDNKILAASINNKITLLDIYKKIDTNSKKLTEMFFTVEENLITLQDDKTVMLWDNGNGIRKKKYDSQPFLSSDRKTIMTAHADTVVKIGSVDSNKLTPLQGYNGTLKEIRFSPDGKIIAAINGDNTIKIWRNDGTLLRTFTGSAGKIVSLKFSPDSQLMAVTGNNKIDVWNRNSDRITTLSEHNYIIKEVLFSPDNQRIVTIDSGNVAKLWNRDGKLIATLEKHLDGIQKILFSPNSQLIASIGEDNLVNLWSRNGKLIQRLIRHREGINSISFSPNSQILASVSSEASRYSSSTGNSTVKLWRRDGTLLSSIETVGVVSINFSSDSKTIASIHENKVVKLWKVDGTPVTTLRGHNDWITSVSFSSNNQLIASASVDRTIRLWNSKGEQIKVFRGHDLGVDRVSFSEEGTIVSVSNLENEETKSTKTTLRLWTVDGTELATIKGNSEEDNTINFSNDSEPIESVAREIQWYWETKEISNVKLSSDGQLINSVRQDDESNYTVEFWDTQGKMVNSISEKEPSRFAFSPDGRMVAIATERNHSLKLWGIDGEALATIKDPDRKINSASISPDGKIIASASNDNSVKLWRKNGNFIKALPGHSDKVNTVSFSPDDRIIASGSDDKTVRLWTREGEPIVVPHTHRKASNILQHTDKVNRIVFSPDGKYIAAASEDETVKIWETDCILGRENIIIKIWKKDCAEGKTIDAGGDLLSFSPDNKMLAIASSGSSGVSLYLLNGMWFKEAHLLSNDRVRDISFGPDSQSIAVAHEDRVSILKWDIDELLQEACRLGRDHLKHNKKSDRHLCDGFKEEGN